MTDNILENLNTWVTNAVDLVTQVSIAAQPFDLQDDNYRQAYDKIYRLYWDVNKARMDLPSKVEDVVRTPVSIKISGVTQGATLAQSALIGADQGSLLNALLALEVRLSKLLTAMHASYVEFLKTDRESAFKMFSAAEAP